jgi:hypothetical protein
MKSFLALIGLLLLIGLLIGCQCQSVPKPPKKEVTADGHTFFACEGTLDITQTNGGYDIHLTDQGYVNGKVTETEFYLHGVKYVAVAPSDFCVLVSS